MLKFLEVFRLNRWNHTLTTLTKSKTNGRVDMRSVPYGFADAMNPRTFGSSTANSISR